MSLTQQEAFAHHFVANGGNGTQAAIAAGYAENSARQQAYKLSRNESVQRLIREEQRRLLGGRLCSLALAAIEGVLLDPEAPAGAKIDAARLALTKGGFDDKNADQGRIIEIPTGADLERFIEAARVRLAELDQRRAELELLPAAAGDKQEG